MEIRNVRQTNELALKAQEQALETRQIQLCWQATERVMNKEYFKRIVEILYHQDFKDYEEWLEKSIGEAMTLRFELEK